MEKTPVILLYGGRSTEHEISCRSAAFVVRNIDRHKYHLHAIGITKQGLWCPQDVREWEQETPEVLPIVQSNNLSDSQAQLLRWFQVTAPRSLATDGSANTQGCPIVFGLLHGTGGEDGSIQGLLELCNLAYVGPDTMGSALAMDKILTKELASAAGISVVPYVWFRKSEWQKDPSAWLQRITRSLTFPLFVKPARLGSSVGVSKVQDGATLERAIDLAFSVDDKLLVETGMQVREIEFAVMGGYHGQVSMGGESIAKKDYYDYNSKYVDKSASEVMIPADINTELHQEGKRIALKVFESLHLYGLARVDLFLTSQGRYYLNEVNTIPGFTSISQFPSLWIAEGKSPKDILDCLLTAAKDRQDSKNGLVRSFESVGTLY